MKIAFIRGPNLNPWELQSYQPLSQIHDFTAIGADWQFYKDPIDIAGIHVQKAHAWGAWLMRSGSQWPIKWNRALSWSTGQSYGLSHLEAVVGKTDIIHSAEMYSTQTYQALQLKRRTGCGLAVTVWENLPGMGETHPVRKRRKKEVIQNVDGVLAVTETTRRLMIQEGVAPERISVIFPGIDSQRFQPTPRDTAMVRQFDLKPDDFIILFIGRLVAEKGVGELLQAAREILAKPHSRQIRFLFAGDGPMRREVENLRQTFPRGVLATGFVHYDAISKLHNLADIFVLPSKAAPKWQEQFGYVLVESMACGKPVITTRSGSIPDVVGDAAILVEANNASALRQAMENLINSNQEQDRLGDLGRARVRRTFSLDVVAPQLIRFYDRVEKRLPVNET